MKPLEGQIALVAGATRGAGRAIAMMQGEAGATVYCTGRGIWGRQATGTRPETIEETADKQFLFVDSPLFTPANEPSSLPNVRAVTYRAGLAVKQYEAGFRAGGASTNPKATVVASYTGSFTNFASGVDSDHFHLAPKAMLRDRIQGRFLGVTGSEGGRHLPARSNKRNCL
jgi:hypothetical protein